MDSARRSALAAGVPFILTFVTSIPALVLYGPVLNDAHYVLGPGADTRIFAGAFLEVLLVAAGLRDRLPPGTPRGALRGPDRHLAHVQGIPAVPDHRGNGPGGISRKACPSFVIIFIAAPL